MYHLFPTSVQKEGSFLSRKGLEFEEGWGWYGAREWRIPVTPATTRPSSPASGRRGGSRRTDRRRHVRRRSEVGPSAPGPRPREVSPGRGPGGRPDSPRRSRRGHDSTTAPRQVVCISVVTTHVVEPSHQRKTPRMRSDLGPVPPLPVFLFWERSPSLDYKYYLIVRPELSLAI